MTPDQQSAWLTAVIITLIAAPFLMALIPRCSHPECKTAHAEANDAQRKVTQVAQIERLHAFHDRFRPQRNCPLCMAVKHDDDPDPES